eukprot:226042-Pyramimonas_sp.AAC.1
MQYFQLEGTAEITKESILDVMKLRGQSCCEKFQATLNNASLPEWLMDVNDHLDVVNTTITTASQSCFGTDRLTSVKGCVGQQTMCLARLRRCVARARRWLPHHATKEPPWTDVLAHADDHLFHPASSAGWAPVARTL